MSPEASLPQAEQAQLPHPFIVGEIFQPSDHFCGSPLYPLQQLHIIFVLEALGMDAVLQEGPHEPV